MFSQNRVVGDFFLIDGFGRLGGWVKSAVFIDKVKPLLNCMARR